MENDPRVTMIGGISRRVIKSALSAPPANPSTMATSAATPIGSPPSRQAAPKTTAASPIIEPTDKSMPPVIITGVSASARSPNSTLRRTTSKKLAVVKKLGASAENAAISSERANSRIHSPLGKARACQVLRSLSGKVACIFLRAAAQRVDRDRGQNDRALERPLPVGADAQKR